MMGEKTYDAIYKIAKNADSDVILLWTGHVQIEGILLDCEDNKCQNGIISLQDAVVRCKKHGEEAPDKHFKWLNIPACHINAFTFQCCLVEE